MFMEEMRVNVLASVPADRDIASQKRVCVRGRPPASSRLRRTGRVPILHP
jgi:hypothetical protein